MSRSEGKRPPASGLRTNCRVKPLKSHKSKQGTNLFYSEGCLFYADAAVKKVIKYSVDDQDILATLYTKCRSAFILPIYKKSKLPSEFCATTSVLISDGLNLRLIDLDSKAEMDVYSLEDLGYEWTIGSAVTHNSGRLFFSVVSIEQERVVEHKGGWLCCMRPSGRVQKLFEGICLSEGLCFNKDCSRLFAVDMSRNRVISFAMDQTNIQSPTTLINWAESPLAEGQVKGLATDHNDHLWMSCSGEGKVIEVDVESRAVLREIVTPKAKELSSLCFGGADYRELFVASSYAGLSQEELTKQVHAGHIFNAKGYVGLRGRKSTPVNLDLLKSSIITGE